MSIFNTIDSPDDLKKLSEEQLPIVAQSMRQLLLETLNETGGHFGSNLGTVELTIALHYVFNTPKDKLIWDVGHQAYPHKILTKRKKLISTIRQKGGLAPFPYREESIYDAFTVGHAGTSISAALGMAEALKYKKQDSYVIPIIGDGSMTAGLALEALNHAGSLKSNMLVILNDNNMSISENVGAISDYLSNILSSKLYATVKKGSKKIFSRIPPVWELARRTETHLKGMVFPGTFFEELGFNYLGPIDGHNVTGLVKILRKIKNLSGPQLLHVITKKGKGYTPAEENPTKFHAVPKGYYYTEVKKDKTEKQPTFSDVFGQWLCDMAAIEPNLVGITPAMREGSGLVEFAKQYPDRYFDVGIAEQHSVTLAAGLACENLKPVVAIYSSFLQRAYDQLIHDVAIPNLPVLFAIDRGGLVTDGPTHSGNYDLSFLRCIPNMVIMAPSDAIECRNMLYTGANYQGPVAVRYPRGTGPKVSIPKEMENIPIGKSKLIRQGENIAILCFGTLLSETLKVAEVLNATVIDMRFIKPIDEARLIEIADSHELIITIEENAIMGGAGSAANEYLLSQNKKNQIINIGIPDFFVDHGTQDQMLASCGLNFDGILKSIKEKICHTSCKKAFKALQSA